MADRVEKFAADQAKALAQPARAQSEIGRLRGWLQKHQEECLPDGAKARLLTVVQQYHKAGLLEDKLAEPAAGLVEDLLKLPEGKLVTAKAKKSALKWLESGRAAGGASEPETEPREWLVVEVQRGAGGRVGLELVDELTGETGEAECVGEEPDGLKLFEEGAVVRAWVGPGGELVRLQAEPE